MEFETDELKMADMESRLREMIIATVRPSIMKIANSKTKMEEIWATLKVYGNQIQEIASEMQLTSERSNLILDFKNRLDDASDRIVHLDLRLSLHEKEIFERLQVLEHKCEMQVGYNSATDRTLERVMQDFDVVHTQHRRLTASLEAATLESRHHINSEAATLKASLSDIVQELQRFQAEVWGPEEHLSDILPPSLRRLDHQMRKIAARCADMAHDLTFLRQLDIQMQRLSASQQEVTVDVKDLAALTTSCREQVVKIAADTQAESRAASNRMAAFTASLTRDLRDNIELETKALKAMHLECEQFTLRSQDGVDVLRNSVEHISAYVSAALKQLHADVDSLEIKRRRDKQTSQDGLKGLQDHLVSAAQVSESTLRGLEHVTSVVSMALQGERISVALDVQDFVDRKATPYVGIREAARSSKAWDVRKKDGLDPTTLTRLIYDPKPVLFQGSSFERAQLCALRERVVHAAQEMLFAGPGTSASALGRKIDEMKVPLPMVPAALGVSADMPLPSRRTPPAGAVSCPGSRGQPSARGSPPPLFDRGEDAHWGKHGTPEDGPHLPALTSAVY